MRNVALGLQGAEIGTAEVRGQVKENSMKDSAGKASPTRQRSRGSAERRMTHADLARFREATYRLISQTFLYPDEERLSRVVAAADELLREGDVLARFAFFERWCELLRFLNTLDPQEAEKVQGEFVPLFVANARGVPCPPYESVYREPSGRPSGWLLGQIEGEYAAAGLTPSPNLGDLPDHVAVETEFMAVLCGREAEAWESEEQARAIKALGVQSAFAESHLNRWFPQFAQQVTDTDEGSIYPVICQGAQVFFAYDRDLVKALLEAPPGGYHETGITTEQRASEEPE